MRKNKNFITSVKNRDSHQLSNDFVSIILLCDKSGKRMKSYGPTPLVNVNGKKLLELQIHAIQSIFKNFEIIIACGFESEKVIKFVRNNYYNLNIRVVENQIYHYSNCCESLRLCINNTVNDAILIINGDLLFHPDSLSSIHNNKNFIISQKEYQGSNLEIGVIANHENQLSIGFHYGIKDNLWAEICFLKGKDIIDPMRKIISSVEYKNRLMFEALNWMIDNNFQLKMILNEGPEIIKINNIKTLREVNSLESYHRKLFK